MNDALDPILQEEVQRKLKVQLAWRLGIAALLILLALFGINWLDRKQEAAPAAATTHIPQIAPPTTLPLPSAAPAPPEASQAASSVESTSPPALSSASGLIEGAPHKSAASSAASVPPKPSFKIEPAPAVAKSPAAPQTAATPAPTALPTPTSAPIAAPIATAAPTSAPQAYPAAQHSANGYTVQAGVFLKPQNASKLLAQLQAANIPAYIETRVQIGPFKDKASADAAAAKLKRLGIEPVIRGN